MRRMSGPEELCWAFWMSFISAPVWAGLGGASGALGHAFIEGCREKNSKEIVSTEAVALAAVLGNLFLMTPITFGTLLSVASESAEHKRNAIFTLAALSCFFLSPISGVIGAATQKQSENQLGYTTLAVFNGAAWVGLIGLCLGGIIHHFFCNRRDTPTHTNNAPNVVLERVPHPAPVVVSTRPDIVFGQTTHHASVAIATNPVHDAAYYREAWDLFSYRPPYMYYDSAEEYANAMILQDQRAPHSHASSF